MPDIANFVAQNFNPQQSQGNALLLAQNLTNARSQNALRDQQTRGLTAQNDQQNALREALAQGAGLDELIGLDPAVAGQVQGVRSKQNIEAAQRVAAFSGQVARSKNPGILAKTLLESPEFTSAAETLGMDISQIGDLSEVPPERIQEIAADLENMAVAFSTGNRFGAIGNADLPSDVRSALFLEQASPDQRENFLTAKRNRQIIEIEGGKVDATDRGREQVLSTPEAERGAAAALKKAEAEASASVVPASDRAGAATKIPRVAAAQREIVRVEKAVEDLAKRNVFKGGPGQSALLSVTKEGQELEQANAQLLANLTALTRIPGVGAQSDFEQRLLQMQLADARFRPEVNEAAMKELRLFVDDLESALEALANGKIPGFDAEGNPVEEQTDNDPLGLRR